MRLDLDNCEDYTILFCDVLANDSLEWPPAIVARIPGFESSEFQCRIKYGVNNSPGELPSSREYSQTRTVGAFPFNWT